MNMRTPSRAKPDDELPYVIELWEDDSTDKVARILAKASSLHLAQAILKSAEQEYPERRVTLRSGSEVIAEARQKTS